MGGPTDATTNEWIALPLHDCPKSELRDLGVPAPLLRAVRGATSLEDLRALELEPALRERLELLFVQRRGTGPRPPRNLSLAFNLDHLSDLRRELVELLVALDPRQQEIVDRALAGGLLRVRGVAGSGKTQVLLHALAKRLYGSPHSADLLWSYNRNLIDTATVLLRRLAGPRAQRTHVDTFDRWCLRSLGGGRRILDDRDDERLRLLHEARLAARRASGAPEQAVWGRDDEFWRQELDWIRDQPLDALEDYLEVERVGRGTRLDRAQRRLVWLVHERYGQALAERGACDWRQLRLDAYRQLQATRTRRYDHVFIDEAQDLPPLALRMAALLAGENVTLALDGSQAIYRKGFRWRDLGLGPTRTTTLGTCYRTTAQIARAAERFRAREEEPIAWTVERSGPRPRAVDVAPPAWEADWIADELSRRIRAGELRPGNVAVLGYTRQMVRATARTLQRHGLLVADGAVDPGDDRIRVLTMSGAKGLEFPLVYLAPLLDHDFFPRRRDEDEDEHRLECERRQRVLYVAMTRARDELVLVHRGGRARQILSGFAAQRIVHEQGRVGP